MLELALELAIIKPAEVEAFPTALLDVMQEEEPTGGALLEEPAPWGDEELLERSILPVATAAATIFCELFNSCILFKCLSDCM